MYPEARERAGALAYHWQHADNVEKEAHYLTIAGEHAVQVSAFREGRAAFSRLLYLSSEGVITLSAQRIALLQIQLARTQFWLGEFDIARDGFSRGLTVALALDDQALVAQAAMGIADVYTQLGNFDTAREYYQQSYEAAQLSGDAEQVAHSLIGLGDIEWKDAEYDSAEEHLQAGLAIARDLNDKTQVASALNMLGIVFSLRGDPTTGERYFEDSLAVSQEIGDRERASQVLNNLGELARQRKDYELAKQRMHESLDIRYDIGNPIGAIIALINLGFTALEQENLDEAQGDFYEALATSYRASAYPLILNSLGGFAEIRIMQGRVEEGAELLGVVTAHPAFTPHIRRGLTMTFDRLAAALSPEASEAAMARGRERDFAAVVKQLLGKQNAP